jgi:Concanavalin A-like lectin/glucanases superfamily
MKLLKSILIALFVASLFVTGGSTMSSCTKETIIRDTIIRRDTIFKRDTLRIIDSVCYNLKDSLVAWYKFTAGSLKDSSGKNNDIVFNNATATADRFGKANNAFLFNGNGSYMKVTNSPSLNTANKISLFAIVKVNGFYPGTCHGNRIIMKGDADFLSGNYTLTFDDNAYTNAQNCFIVTPDTLHQNFFGLNTTAPPGGYTPYVQKNQWYTLVYTSDGITSKMYVNGELKAAGPANNITFSNGADLYFGRLNNSQYPYWFNGVIDEIRIYNKALCDGEVSALNKLKD